MALGDYNNNKPKYKELEVYSNYGMTNAEGVVDPSALSISFFRNLMKIAIAPKLQNGNGNQKWDNDNAAAVYLKREYYIKSLKMFWIQKNRILKTVV